MRADPFDVADRATDPYAAIADWLAALFMMPPAVETIAACRSADGDLLLVAMGHELGSTAGIERMRIALSSGGSVADSSRQLSRAYMLLFEGPGGPATVALCESAYEAAHGRLFQQPTEDVESLLRDLDLAVASGCREPADHVSIQLSLLARLLRSGDGQRLGTLRERLLAWTPRFAAACNQVDPTGFYSGAAMVLQQLLKTASIHRSDFLPRPELEEAH
jgi:TorA-specific chaperone